MKNLESIISSGLLLLAQSGIIFVLVIMRVIIESLTYNPVAGYVISGLITFSLYGLIWLLIWRAIYLKNGVSQFFFKLTVASIPLIVLTAWYVWLHPTPEYNDLEGSILPSVIHFTFATAVTGTLLFPLYSILLNRYLFLRGCTWLRFLVVSSLTIAVGTGSFTLCYIFLPAQW